MTPDRWRQIEDIFQEALDLPPEGREHFLAKKCLGDNDLRGEVEKLIERFEHEETFLESPVWTDSRFLQSQVKRDIARSLDEEILPALDEKSAIGERVGVYELTEELGRGGMGVVYLALRADGEFRQKVAVKLIKRGMDTDFIVRRFRHERQILANLNHPNVARLLDGGTTKDGRPYFIMEFVEGEPLLRFCESRQFDLRRRLELFLDVCGAVAYAHRRKIVHRDIKPGNILVTGEGEVKLLDFGIAKILDADLAHDSAVRTATAMRMMTPEYASPEQIKGETVTPASDQYSLGILLYELVTGARPYKFPSRSPYEVARVICEEIPSMPSESGGKIIEASDLALDPDFCRRLDQVVLKTLQKNPAERYGSVEDFAADIRRFLHGEPLLTGNSALAGKKINPPVPNTNERKPVAAAANTNGTSVADTSPSGEKIVSPRRTGVKQGLFLVISSFLSLPITFAVAFVTGIPAILQFFVFVCLFFGGLIRLFYAAFFESSRRLVNVPSQSNSFSESEPASPTPALTSNERRMGRMPAALKYSLAAIALIVFSLVVYNVAIHTTFDFSTTPPGERWRNNFTATMNAARLTTSGAASASAISPDGKRLAFSQRDGDLQSLWVRETDSGEQRRVVEPGGDNLVGVSFSPDGNFVLYTAYNPKDASWALYRVGAAGGERRKILSDIISSVSFARDGKSFAYFHLDAKTRLMSLFVSEAQADGTPTPELPRKIAERLMPEYFTASPAISPDGRKVAFPAVSLAGSKDFTELFVVDVENGKEEMLGVTDFNQITGIAWRENGEEIVLTGNRKNSEPMQLLLATYPSGEITRLSSDLSDYSGVSLTSDSAALVTARKNLESGISVIDLKAAKTGSETVTEELTGGNGRQDGRRGVGWTADGRVVFVSRDDDETKVVLMNADGSNKQIFDLGDAVPANPQITPDNRFLFFLDQKEKLSEVKRYEPATGEMRQINSGLSLAPVLTADSRHLLFSTVNAAFRTSLHRVPIEGGEAKELTSAACIRPAVSPDGRFLTCYYKPEQFSGKWQLAILNSEGGAPIRFIEPPDTVSLMNAFERPTAWSKDSHSIYYINDKGGVSNIYRINADGSGEPEQITNFASGRIFDFALSPDGNRVVLARGSVSSDVVIFRKSKN